MLGAILSFFTSSAFKSITDTLTEVYLLKLKAETDIEKMKFDEIITRLEAQRDILLVEQQNAATRWVRPAFAMVVWLYWAKLVVYDTLLGWGSTPYPGDHVAWFVTIIPAAYFLVRPIDKLSRVTDLFNRK